MNLRDRIKLNIKEAKEVWMAVETTWNKFTWKIEYDRKKPAEIESNKDDFFSIGLFWIVKGVICLIHHLGGQQKSENLFFTFHQEVEKYRKRTIKYMGFPSIDNFPEYDNFINICKKLPEEALYYLCSGSEFWKKKLNVNIDYPSIKQKPVLQFEFEPCRAVEKRRDFRGISFENPYEFKETLTQLKTGEYKLSLNDIKQIVKSSHLVSHPTEIYGAILEGCYLSTLSDEEFLDFFNDRETLKFFISHPVIKKFYPYLARYKQLKGEETASLIITIKGFISDDKTIKQIESILGDRPFDPPEIKLDLDIKFEELIKELKKVLDSVPTNDYYPIIEIRLTEWMKNQDKEKLNEVFKPVCEKLISKIDFSKSKLWDNPELTILWLLCKSWINRIWDEITI